MNTRQYSLAAALAVGAIAFAIVSGSQQNAGSALEPTSPSAIRDLGAHESALGHSQQARTLQDGKVSPAEYSAEFELLARCVSSRGVTVTPPQMDPVSNDRFAFSYNFAGLEKDFALRSIDACEIKYWDSVSAAYTAGIKPVMDPALATATANCLAARGLVVTGAPTSVRAFTDQFEHSGAGTVVDCIESSVQKLYPQLTSFSIGGF